MNGNSDKASAQARLLPREGAFHAVRLGHRRRWREDIYVRLMEVRWPFLFCGFAALYLTLNLIFAAAYVAADGINGARPGSFADAFFFSVQTLSTIGYGTLSPSGTAANLLVTVEAMLGFAYFAVVTGLMFAKFSRPTARVLFSDKAVVCPYNGVPHLMLRLANQRGNRIVDAKVHVTVLRDEVSAEGHKMRRFHDLPPVRERVPVLQLTWTVMHPLDEKSPLHGLTPEMLRDGNMEIVISLTGLDETLSQIIHARYSYIAEEVAFGHAFADILRRTGDGGIEVDYRRFHEVVSIL
ncbi:MAG: ATP-sensitive inward rectifier potassium channel 10 [Pseudomonadota bacterium]|nr:ATP-sensitive inward rectifier potassium channel 10 [Pseudomonadota bacterium]MDE3037214.1 ATP-sensitive inward rectifier potassium channel 10 [Pseudomonadota bacterium]